MCLMYYFIIIILCSLAHSVLSLKLIADSHWFLKAFLWVVFPLILILFSVGFVQLVSVHAIGMFKDQYIIYTSIIISSSISIICLFVCLFIYLYTRFRYTRDEDRPKRCQSAQLPFIQDLHIKDCDAYHSSWQYTTHRKGGMHYNVNHTINTIFDHATKNEQIYFVIMAIG